MQIRWLFALTLVVASACGDNLGGGAGPDGTTPDGGDPDAGIPDAIHDAPPDAGVDAGPFPLDPHAGQYEWAVIIPGVEDQVVMATGSDGSIFIAGTHSGPIAAGDVDLPAPVGSAIAVLKLDARARPIWGRSLGGGDATWRTNVRSITLADNGDVVVGGAFVGAGFDPGTGPLPAVAQTDGFVARLDGTSGVTRWARSFAGSGDDDVSTVAADPTSDALYVYGTVSGHAFLDRYDRGGQQVWSRELALRVSWQQELALDPVRGPVVSGRYYGRLDVDSVHLEVEPGDEDGNLVVLGFTPAGTARFARQIFDENQGYYQRLLAAPAGKLYVATTTEADEIVLDDEHALKGPDFSSDAVLMRMTPDGVHDWATLIDAELAAYPRALAADTDGAVYLLGSCDRTIILAPTIGCLGGGSFLVSYGPDGEYRWSTYVYGNPGWAQAIAAVPGADRLLVAGQVGETASFGGIQIPGSGLFVASVVTGPTHADPLPPPPVVTSVVLDGVADGQVRQGGTATVVVSGEHLDQVKSVRVGSRDVFVADGTPGTLRVPYVVPHGELLGPLRLVLTHPGGQLDVPSGLQVSPLVVSPSGTDSGRGTPASPWRLCRDDWQTMALRGDTIRLLAGEHGCDEAIYLQRGVIVEGAGTTLTRLGTAARPFQSFSLGEGPHGKTRISGLTFERGGVGMFTGVADVSLRDVDFVGLSTPGVSLDFARGRMALERVRYLDGHSPAIYGRGNVEVDGRHVTIQTDNDGIRMWRGQLTLRDSSIAARATAIEIGNLNDSTLQPRLLVLERSWLSGLVGVTSYGADISMFESELVGVGTSPSYPGGYIAIEHVGGTLTLGRTRIRTFDHGIWRGGWGLDGGDYTTNVDLDEVDVVVTHTGVSFGHHQATNWLRMRGSTIAAGTAALRISDAFASVDLGTSAAPGDNALSSSPAGHALVDNRDGVGAAIDAVGTTLNGHGYSGQLVGPRDEADLTQRAANVVRF